MPNVYLRNVPRAVLWLWLLLLSLELAACLYLSGGRLVFTLDDPYIHLAVADRILSGGYGVNASEYSSPSSSIVWPYLLAVTELLHLGAAGPLLINMAATFATLRAALRLFAEIGLIGAGRDRLFSVVIAILLLFAFSAVALPMTGMEHSVHVWASVLTLIGLVRAARGERPGASALLAVVLLPLIRFEGMAFAVAAVAGYAVLGQRRLAAVAGGLILCAMGAYLASMALRGLPLLPSSVLLKSQMANAAYDGSSALGSIGLHLLGSLSNPYGLRLTLLGVAIAYATWRLREDRASAVVLATVLVAIAAHLAFGAYDWFHRYEVYIIALSVMALLYAVARLRPQLDPARWTAVQLGLGLLVGYVGAPYLMAAIQTPLAARNIYDQQYQMGVFARDLYKRPVAVNDLGLVAYRNPNFVLDLWGLGSEKVRKAKLAGRYGPDEMAALARDYHVGLAMIYDRWFPAGIPDSWQKVAVLHTDQVTAAVGEVAFYRTPDGDPAVISAALDAFGAVLPARDRLVRVTAGEPR